MDLDLDTLTKYAAIVAVPSAVLPLYEKLSGFLRARKEAQGGDLAKSVDKKKPRRWISRVVWVVFAISASVALSSFVLQKALEAALQEHAKGLEAALEEHAEVTYIAIGAGEAYQKKNFRHALERYSSAVELAPGKSAKFYLLKKQGDSHRMLGEYPQAVQSYRAALKENPDSDGALTALAIALTRLKEFPKALEEIKKVRVRDSIALYTHARVHAFWWIDQGRFEDDKNFKEACRLYTECQSGSGSYAPWCYYDEAGILAIRLGATGVSLEEKAALSVRVLDLLRLAFSKAKEITKSDYSRMRDNLETDTHFNTVKELDGFQKLVQTL